MGQNGSLFDWCEPISWARAIASAVLPVPEIQYIGMSIIWIDVDWNIMKARNFRNDCEFAHG
jgi:hypothetical protein